jgi:hypothetical protein
MTTDQKRLTPQAEENLIDAAWHPIDEAIDCLEYDSDKNIMAKAREKLTGQKAQLIRRQFSRPHRAVTGKQKPAHFNQQPPNQSNSPSRPRRIHT